jgi:hypothetical protein
MKQSVLATLAPPPRKRRRWWLYVLVALVLLAGYGILLLYSVPAWYRPLDPTAEDTQIMVDRTQEVLLNLHNALEGTSVGPQQWEISQDQINALLAVTFRPESTLGQQLHKIGGLGAKRPMVVFLPGRVGICTMAEKLPGRGEGGVVSVFGEIRIEQNSTPPMGQLVLTSLQAGALPLPTRMADERLRQALRKAAPAVQDTLSSFGKTVDNPQTVNEFNTMFDLIAKGERFPLNFTYRRHKVRVQAVEVTQGKITVTFVSNR